MSAANKEIGNKQIDKDAAKQEAKIVSAPNTASQPKITTENKDQSTPVTAKNVIQEQGKFTMYKLIS